MSRTVHVLYHTPPPILTRAPLLSLSPICLSTGIVFLVTFTALATTAWSQVAFLLIFVGVVRLLRLAVVLNFASCADATDPDTRKIMLFLVDSNAELYIFMVSLLYNHGGRGATLTAPVPPRHPLVAAGVSSH